MYFATDLVTGMWRRFARALAPFPHGLYLSDLMYRNRNPLLAGFTLLLSAFVRGQVHMHYDNSRQAVQALSETGFDGRILDPRNFAGDLRGLETIGAGRVRIIEAVARRG
jgi:hypothetical protein